MSRTTKEIPIRCLNPELADTLARLAADGLRAGRMDVVEHGYELSRFGRVRNNSCDLVSLILDYDAEI